MLIFLPIQKNIDKSPFFDYNIDKQLKLIIFVKISHRVWIKRKGEAMDLRMVRTRKQIKDAFLTLCRKMMPDKIRVKDICELAMINKTTFYNHYADSAALAAEIDEHLIDKVLSGFTQKDEIFRDPRTFIKKLLFALEAYSEDIRLVFRGKQEVLCAKLEERLCRMYGYKSGNTEENMRISFIIGGFLRIVKDYLFFDVKYDIEQVADSTARMLEPIIFKSPIVIKNIN